MQFIGKKQPTHTNAYESSLAVFDDVLGKDKVMKFQERFDEGYDVADELYTVWTEIKKLSLTDPPLY